MASLMCAYAMKLPALLVAGSRIHFNWNSLFYKKSIIPSANLFIIMFTYGGLMSFIALYGIEIGIANSSLFFLSLPWVLLLLVSLPAGLLTKTVQT